MNKNQLIYVLADRNGYTTEVNEKVIDNFLGVVTECLVSGESVQMSGFGIFDIHISNPRIGTNPRTFEKLEIGHYARLSFRAGRALKAAIKNSDLAVERAREVQAGKPKEAKIKKINTIE